MNQAQRSITLLPAEQLLREFLLEGAESFPGLELWVTGGWVRDRLLGMDSPDLDLALSNLTGKEFGTFLEAFSAKPEVESRYKQRANELGIPGSLFTRFHIMKKNASMSKQLETAGGKLFGLDVDLVNLRKEVYDGQSRNPEMEFGTAEEDAFRRDATVNALFFHLQRQEVVDLTGQGLQDLEARIMRTPLEPRQTFMDDPLRVLRLIRIGSKLSFNINMEAVSCMREPQIHKALDTMITRDRIGAELTKMMRSHNPEVAFRHIFDCQLYAPIFVRLPSSILTDLASQFPFMGIKQSSPWPSTWSRAFELVREILSGGSTLGKLVGSEEQADFLWTMVAYTPLAGLRHSHLKEVVEESASAIRMPSKISQLLDSSLKHFDSISSIVDAAVTQPGPGCSRSTCGMAIRAWGPTWTTQLTYVILARAVYHHDKDSSQLRVTRMQLEDRKFQDELLDKYTRFASFIYDQKLQDAHLQRPLLNGTEIQGLFGLKKGGKYLKGVMDGIIEWHFDHPDASREDAETWLLEQREALGVPAK